MPDSKRKLADAMRFLVDQTLPDLAYNIAFLIRGVDWGWHGHYHHVKFGPFPWNTKKVLDHIPNQSYFRGDVTNYSQSFRKTVIQDGTLGTVYEYRPVDGNGNPGNGVIQFHTFALDDITDVQVLPSKSLPQGPPQSKVYRLTNSRPDPDERQFDHEESSEQQKEQTFGWLVSAEFEESTRVHAGVAVSTELSATLRQRVEAHGDRRWSETFSVRDSLRGTYPVSAWGIYERKLTTQEIELSQRVLVTGKLNCGVTIIGDDQHGPQTFTSLDEMLDALRGLGGPGYLGEWFGKSGNAVPEDGIQNSIIAHLPIVVLNVGPKDQRIEQTDDKEREVPVPGHEDDYAAARKSGVDAALDTELGSGAENWGDWAALEKEKKKEGEEE